MDPTPSSAVAEIDRLIEEGRRLIAQAEACRRSLTERGAQEGHLLMAARVIAAMTRVQATLMRQRAALIEAARVPTVAVVAERTRPWWPFAGRRVEARPS